MKLIIAGSRTFSHYEYLKQEVDELVKYVDEEIQIVCGCAKGADELGEKYAKEKGYPVKYFPANWKKNGKAAGPIRNNEMAEYATHLVCFWNGISKGTASMIEIANRLDLVVRVIKI